jgi:hypothetical protein
MQPRIYTYKITFEEVPYYYYGSKKEKYFNEEYWGSPVTNKWCWKLYTPKKQILEFFEYSETGYFKCREIEDRLIKPVLNDPWCLNESCGGSYSLKILIENGRRSGKLVGKIIGNYHKENKTGIFSLTKEEKRQNSIKGGRIGGKINAENKTGVFGRSKEKMSQDGKKGGSKSGNMNIELGRGIFALTLDERIEMSRKNGLQSKNLKIGIHRLTKDELRENGKLGYANGLGKLSKEDRSETAKKVNSQKWMCTETGFVTNAGNLTKYQRKRNIDTSKRVRIS